MSHVSTRTAAWRAGLGIAAAALLLLTGCSSSTNSTAVQPNSVSSVPSVTSTTQATTGAVANGTERAIGDVPWPQADAPPPCQTGQVVAQYGLQQSASGHREVVLKFVLAPGGQACTLTGYPGVDSGAGGPLLHADRTLSGFQGGLRTDKLPTVTVAADQPQYAVVEGVAVDRNDPYRKCPTYTELLVTPPDTTETFTVPVKDVDTCELQVHPMGSEW